jgi:hypothetical protein
MAYPNKDFILTRIKTIERIERSLILEMDEIKHRIELNCAEKQILLTLLKYYELQNKEAKEQ